MRHVVGCFVLFILDRVRGAAPGGAATPSSGVVVVQLFPNARQGSPWPVLVGSWSGLGRSWGLWMAFKSGPNGPGGSKMTSKMARDCPRWPPRRPKRAPSSPRRPPRRPKGRPRGAPRRQNSSVFLKLYFCFFCISALSDVDASMTSPDCPRQPQDGPKMAPRLPKMAP